MLLCGVNIPRPENTETPADYGIEYETISITSSVSTRIELWVLSCREPIGTAAMFHGYASSKSRQLQEAALFHSLGWNVIMADFEGSGGSDGSLTTIGFAEAGTAADVLRFARERCGDKPVIAFGTSMGAAAVMKAVADRITSSPDALIIECPFDRLLSTVRHRFDSMRIPSFPFAELLVAWGGFQHGYNGFKHNPVKYAESVNCPVLLLHGSDDRRVTPDEARSLAAAIRQPVLLHFFPDVGHDSYIAAHPEEYGAVTASWLDSMFSPESHAQGSPLSP